MKNSIPFCYRFGYIPGQVTRYQKTKIRNRFTFTLAKKFREYLLSNYLLLHNQCADVCSLDFLDTIQQALVLVHPEMEHFRFVEINLNGEYVYALDLPDPSENEKVLFEFGYLAKERVFLGHFLTYLKMTAAFYAESEEGKYDLSTLHTRQSIFPNIHQQDPLFDIELSAKESDEVNAFITKKSSRSKNPKMDVEKGIKSILVLLSEGNNLLWKDTEVALSSDFIHICICGNEIRLFLDAQSLGRGEWKIVGNGANYPFHTMALLAAVGVMLS